MAQDAGHTKDESPARRDPSVERAADWQNVFDAIPDMICVLDNDARIRQVNRSFRERVKLPLEQIIGAYCQDVLHSEGAHTSGPFSKEISQTAGAARYPPDIEVGVSRFSMSITPLIDSGGDAAGSVLICHDITDQKRLNEQLMQDRKMESIRRMAGEIAHEINNPLLYISNYLYLFSEELPHDFAKREYVEKIQGGVDKLTVFTQDLIDLSHPVNDVFLPVNIQTILGSSLERMAGDLKEKNIEIVRRFGCGSRLILGSGEKLRQAFMNVIQNAIDAMEQGGSIIVTTSCSEHRVTIGFEDTGAGITDENLHRIFDPFFTTRKDSPRKGAGLGLAICYNIVHSHQGEITVSSKAGIGTTFTVSLPEASREIS